MGRLLATLVRQLGDLDLAEEVASGTVTTALARWPVDGVPSWPAAWLLTVARRRAVDLLRRDRAYAARLALLAVDVDRAEPPRVELDGPDTPDVPDERAGCGGTARAVARGASRRLPDLHRGVRGE